MDNMLIEQKRAELQVKLTILKENLLHLKEQMDKSSNALGNISSQLHSVNKIKESKSNQIKSLESDLQKESNALNALKIYCQSLIKEKEKSGNESLLYKNKLCELMERNTEFKTIIDEMSNKQFESSHMPHSSLMTTNTNQYESNSQNKVKILKIKMEALNKDIKTLEHEKIKEQYSEKYRDDDNDYLNPNFNDNDRNYKPLNLNNNNKEGLDLYDIQIKCVKKEIKQTKDYISSTKSTNETLNNELNELADLLLHINKNNIKINASLNIMRSSLSKKAAYLKHDQQYYEACSKAKTQMMNTFQSIL